MSQGRLAMCRKEVQADIGMKNAGCCTARNHRGVDKNIYNSACASARLGTISLDGSSQPCSVAVEIEVGEDEVDLVLLRRCFDGIGWLDVVVSESRCQYIVADANGGGGVLKSHVAERGLPNSLIRPPRMQQRCHHQTRLKEQFGRDSTNPSSFAARSIVRTISTRSVYRGNGVSITRLEPVQCWQKCLQSNHRVKG